MCVFICTTGIIVCCLCSNFKKLAAHLSSVTKMLMLGTFVVSMEGLIRLVNHRSAAEHGLYPTDVHKSRNQQRVQPVVHWISDVSDAKASYAVKFALAITCLSLLWCMCSCLRVSDCRRFVTA
jgi:hypothetical protein